ncbi:SLATT domain-containing protein [Photobacterium leiognathi]|uniref:SLATT domain-containing protein n=1 Tax=Photobacterium leiognathi TaxID=553611 RepID=UPI002981895C|nr:SLATT domain-containing protein [Photobacterium leiognathi]
MDKDSIWWTRKSWINAEKRLLNYAKLSERSLFWFSLWSLFASILLLGKQQPDFISKVFICFSAFVFGLSLFTSVGRYTERSTKFKNGYIKLQQLYLEISYNGVLNSNDVEKYKSILESCENHDDIDFINAKVEAYLNTKDKTKLSIIANKMDFISYYINKVLKSMLNIILFLLPIIITLISYMS